MGTACCVKYCREYEVGAQRDRMRHDPIRSGKTLHGSDETGRPTPFWNVFQCAVITIRVLMPDTFPDRGRCRGSL